MSIFSSPSGNVIKSRRGGLVAWLQLWGVTALGVLVAAFTSFGSIGFASVGSLLLAALLISFFNVFLRPILVLFALPFVVLTMGLGILLINALLFKLTAFLVDGFIVTSWWAAIWGALVVSVVTLVASSIFFAPRVRVGVYGPAGRGVPPVAEPPTRRVKDDDDVIDV